MTYRERLVKTFSCQEADRAPFGIGLGFWPWGGAMERWKKESGIEDLNIYNYFGYEPGFITPPAGMGPLPHFENKVLEENDEFVISIDSRGIKMRNRRDGESMPEWISHPIKNEDDWLKYKEERLQPRLEERTKGLDEFAEKAKTTDAGVSVGYFPWGVFGTARDLLGAEEILIGFYTMPDLIFDIMETYMNLWLSIWGRIAEKVQIDHIHIWEDMAGRQGSLISMAMVEEFMMPQYDKVAAFARKHNVPTISVDSDGLVDELVPTMMKHGLNAFLPFEVQAGNDIEVYRDKYPTLGIEGGLDKNALARTKKDIDRELAKAERMLAKGGFIPGADHLIPPNVPWENWKYFCEELKRIIGV